MNPDDEVNSEYMERHLLLSRATAERHLKLRRLLHSAGCVPDVRELARELGVPVSTVEHDLRMLRELHARELADEQGTREIQNLQGRNRQ